MIPQPTHEARRHGIEVALADLAEHGVTSAQDYSSDWENFQIYEELEKEGKLTARISEWLPFDESIDELKTQARFASAIGLDAAHRDAEGIHGWLAGRPHGGAAGALCG